MFPCLDKSPDVSMLDVHLWDKIKDIAYQTRPSAPENMVNCIPRISRAEIGTAVVSTCRMTNSCIENVRSIFKNYKHFLCFSLQRLLFYCCSYSVNSYYWCCSRGPLNIFLLPILEIWISPKPGKSGREDKNNWLFLIWHFQKEQ